LTLAALQSGGSVHLQTQGASLTTRSITASANLNIDTSGGGASLGSAIVSGDFTLLTNGGNVEQTGQMVVTGDTTVAAGAGSITLDNAANNFGGSLALQGVSTSVATSGNLQLASVTNTGPMTLRAPNGSIDLGTAFITGGDLTLQSRDDMNLGGANISGNLNMSSTQGTVSFGQATVTGNLIASTQNQDIDLGSAVVGGNLSAQSNGGNIVQSTSLNASLQIAGSSNLNAGTGNVTLPNVPNQFGGVVNLQANQVELVGSQGLVLGTSTVTGHLHVTAATGNISQTGPINVLGGSSLNALQGNVVLDQANNFNQAVALNAINATLNNVSSLALASSTLTGDLKLNSAQGNITQMGPLRVTGQSDLKAAVGNISLDDAANRFGDKVSVETPKDLKITTSGPLTLDKVKVGQNTELQSQGALNLGTGTYTGKLKVNSGGFDIQQSGMINFMSDTDLDAGSAKIDLFNPYNQWRGAILFKGGTILINHPVLMNSVSAGTLIVRANTTMPTSVSASRPGSSSAVLQPVETGQRAGPAVTVSVARPASNGQTGLITVALSTEIASVGKSFSFELDPKLVANQVTDTAMKISQLDGKPMPDWLRFNADTKTFTATDVPAGAFPLQLRVDSGGQESVMVIQAQDAQAP
jgi:hypothetical protein